MRRAAAIICCIIMCLCAPPALDDNGAHCETAMVRIGALKGPTGMGIAPMMKMNADAYAFTLASSPDEMVAMVASGQVDIAALPANTAAALYNKTGGGVKMLALGTLGVLHVLERGDTVHSIGDMAGKTLTMSAQGASSEFTINYILQHNDLLDAVDVAYVSDHAELVTLAAVGRADLIVLPEPFASTLLSKDAGFRMALDITEVFSDTARRAGQPDMELVMGCWIAREAFAAEHPEHIEAFLSDYAASVQYVNAHVSECAQWIAEFGIIPQPEIAEKSLPNCHVVCVAGHEMRVRVEPLLALWYAMDPRSVGGAMPGSEFYHE